MEYLSLLFLIISMGCARLNVMRNKADLQFTPPAAKFIFSMAILIAPILIVIIISSFFLSNGTGAF